MTRIKKQTKELMKNKFSLITLIAFVGAISALGSTKAQSQELLSLDIPQINSNFVSNTDTYSDLQTLQLPASIHNPFHSVKSEIVKSTRKGIASWYGSGCRGEMTASGERYNSHDYTAAHKTLPFGTKVRVTNLSNGRYVVVRINDRGPFVRGREIDLSAQAAKEINMDGLAQVKLEVLNF